jgi:hypothetical protein
VATVLEEFQGNSASTRRTMSEFKLYTCRKCGHEIFSQSQPRPAQWTDGHICHFYFTKEESNNENERTKSAGRSEISEHNS